MDNNFGNNPQNNMPNGQNNLNNGNNKDDGNRKKQNIIIIVIAAIFTILAVSALTNLYTSATSEEITYDKFLDMIEKEQVESVVITTSGKIVITPKGSGDTKVGIKKTYYTTAISVDALYETLDASGVEFKADSSDSGSTILEIIVSWVLPFILIYFFMGMIFKRMGGGAMSVGKSKAKMYMQKETGITFKDVAGQDEAKESLTEIVDFLHNPIKYASIGAKLPKGALLVGPPGTGKTLLAKAVAGEANVPFFSLSGSDFVELYVGVGASRVRDLFKQAQQNAPCIIFIDEIDAIGKSRDSKYGGGNDEREQTLNQLLSEMDGFDSSKGLFILAATNRPDVLDKALLRPGRFDRRIIIDKPDLKGRIETLKVHSKNVAMDETVDLDAIGLATSGAVGSDLANMINEAAINAVKNGRRAISQADLFESVEVVIAGKEKKDRILSEKEKRTVAYHEVGHALITALEKNAEPVQKITIVPRTMGSLGYVMQVPEEEKYLMTKDELIARITTLLGGRASEEIVFDTVTTGASNDMEKATELARAMITQYGMSDKFGLMSLESVEDKYLSGRTTLNCSDVTAAEIDGEVKTLLRECYTKAKALLLENREVLDKIATYLFEKETITGKQFMEIFNEVKGNQNDDEEKNITDVIE
ncbi:MAG: ATP-dependent zinc metalloprotease FtsH [Lachnospiraceae bacterium]|nr:ATP-dependent zinc metalloprotease FtsH [Lachnospiraceae bacterium]